MNTYNQQKKIKLRFFAIYVVSLILIFVVVTAFWEKKSAITQGATSQPTHEDSSPQNGDVERLKNMLAEKDQTIATLQQKAQADLKERNDLISSLQIQLKQTPPGTITNNSSATTDEWKQKYSSLKLSYDKVAESEMALKNAYKTVAEDNRRLLAQLQSIKKD